MSKLIKSVVFKNTWIRAVVEFTVKLARVQVVGKSEQVWKTHDFVEVLFENVHVRETVDSNDGTVVDALAQMIQWMRELILRYYFK